jgi:hypothetical protein
VLPKSEDLKSCDNSLNAGLMLRLNYVKAMAILVAGACKELDRWEQQILSARASGSFNFV